MKCMRAKAAHELAEDAQRPHQLEAAGLRAFEEADDLRVARPRGPVGPCAGPDV